MVVHPFGGGLAMANRWERFMARHRKQQAKHRKSSKHQAAR